MAGSFMRAATTAILVVVYTGQNCKIMQNYRRPKNKLSQTDRLGRRYQKFMVLTTNILCVFCALFHVVSIFVSRSTFQGYLDFAAVNWPLHFLVKIANWQLLLAKMVPINLVMTTRVVKSLQAARLRGALRISRLESARNKQYIAGVPVGDVYNPDSNEDLGTVDYMFIDKTGTLTSPFLAVSKSYVGTYCFRETVIATVDEDQREDEDLRDFQFVEILKDRGSEGHKCREFLRAMAMVNNVEFEQDDQATFKATSPDELALAQYAKAYGAEISNSQDKFNTRTIDEKFFPDEADQFDDDDELDAGSACEYSILFQFDFTHDTRRMSMLVAFQDEQGRDRVSLYIKGALDVLENRVDLGLSPDFEDILIKMEDDLDRGARAMFFCKREFEIEELDRVFLKYFPEIKRRRDDQKRARSGRSKRHTSARAFANLRDSANAGKGLDEDAMKSDLFTVMFEQFPPDRLDELRAELEKGLQFLGASICVERFEPRVEHTLNFLCAAGIKQWVLTGDNLETTLGICNRLKMLGRGSPTRAIFKLDDTDGISEQNFVELDARIDRLKAGRTFALAVTGEYFAKLQGYENTNKLLYNQFCDILMRCETAVFGEMVPEQKRKVVRIVKRMAPEKVTLAVGDGVNDIPMLSEAHVGVALLRENQYNLCKASDYYVQKFSQVKLLLFHFGRGCYRRNSKLVLYMFFKNIFYVMTTFWSGTLNQFSATPLKPLVMENFYGLLLTTFPMLLYGIFDKIFTKQQLLFSPLMYQTGKRRLYLDDRKFIHEVVLSVLFSCYLTFLCLVLFDWGNYSGGVSYGWYNFGNMLTMGIVITVNLRIVILANAWSVWTFVVLVFSVSIYFGIWVYESLDVTSKLYSSMLLLMGTYQFYMFLIYVSAMTVLEYILIKIEYYRIDKKFVPDFDVQFDAIGHTDDAQLELLYSGVSNRELDIDQRQDYYNPEDESEDDGWDDAKDK